jgi:anti-sigma-K factor RskA
MNTYTEAVKEFTTNATAFIEHLPLLTKARAAYEVAIRTSTEMRKILDTSDENLRTLMTQLEQQVNLREVKSATDKKPPEAAKVESIKETNEGGGRAFRWP